MSLQYHESSAAAFQRVKHSECLQPYESEYAGANKLGTGTGEHGPPGIYILSFNVPIDKFVWFDPSLTHECFAVRNGAIYESSARRVCKP